MILLDELDSIAAKRTPGDAGGAGDQLGRRLLGTLLNEMDGVGHKAAAGAEGAPPWVRFRGLPRPSPSPTPSRHCCPLLPTCADPGGARAGNVRWVHQPA